MYVHKTNANLWHVYTEVYMGICDKILNWCTAYCPSIHLDLSLGFICYTEHLLQLQPAILDSDLQPLQRIFLFCRKRSEIPECLHIL